jgi:hypothetical protein
MVPFLDKTIDYHQNLDPNFKPELEFRITGKINL